MLARLRSAVLVSDGMLSAFENVGRPDPPVTAEPVQTGGHGGELLRGGYAPAAWSDAPARPGLERGARDRTVPPHGHPPPGPAAPGRGRRVPGQPGPVRRLTPPRAAAHPGRLLPGEPGRPVVGRGPPGLPAPRAAGPAVLRRPGGPGRPRGSAAGPDHRPAAPRRARGAVPGTARPPAGGQRLEVRAADAAGPGRGERRCGRPTAGRRGGLAAGLRGPDGPAAPRLRPGPGRRGRDVRDRPAVGGRAGAGARRSRTRTPPGPWPPWPRCCRATG